MQLKELMELNFWGLTRSHAGSARRKQKLGLRSACHHAQMNVARWNALNSARARLTSMEHWYGLPEALFDDQTVQNYPPDYNYAKQQDRFSQAGMLWKQAAKPGSKNGMKSWKNYWNLTFTLDPLIYMKPIEILHGPGCRNGTRIIPCPVYGNFTLPAGSLMVLIGTVGGTEQEVEWKENYRIWMMFVNEFKNRG